MNSPTRWKSRAMCQGCWEVHYPGREPIKHINPVQEVCVKCDMGTTSGIYVRIGFVLPEEDPQGREDGSSLPSDHPMRVLCRRILSGYYTTSKACRDFAKSCLIRKEP